MGYITYGDEIDYKALYRHYGWDREGEPDPEPERCCYCDCEGSHDNPLVERRYRTLNKYIKEIVCSECLSEIMQEENEQRAALAELCGTAPSTPTCTHTGDVCMAGTSAMTA